MASQPSLSFTIAVLMTAASLMAMGAGSALAQSSESEDGPGLIDGGGLELDTDSDDLLPPPASATQADQQGRDRVEADRLRRFSLGQDSAFGDDGEADDDALATEDADDDSALDEAIIDPLLVLDDADVDADIDPFAPIGIRRGPLTWFPALDVAVGYDSNVDSDQASQDVRTVTVTPQLRVEGIGRRSTFDGTVIGSLTIFDTDREDERTVDADATYTYDLTTQTQIILRGAYSLDSETVSDDDIVDNASETTDDQEFSGVIGAQRDAGRLTISTEAELSRFLFDDTPLADGGIQSNSDRERFEGTLTLRLQRAEGPRLRPLIEVEAFARRFDEDIDRNGLERDSEGYALRAGVGFADDSALRGEVTIGIAGERFDDESLEDVDTVTASAGLTWDVTALTSVTLDISTDLEATTLDGSGTAVEREATLGLNHALRRNVDLRIAGTVEDTQFSDIDAETTTYTGAAGVTWRVSPVVAFRLDTSYEYEPDDDGDIERFTAEAGVTLAR
ncbi:MAG: outer membrane beta-barrel protein [Pseudomonadota bacterium]